MRETLTLLIYDLSKNNEIHKKTRLYLNKYLEDPISQSNVSILGIGGSNIYLIYKIFFKKEFW